MTYPYLIEIVLAALGIAFGAPSPVGVVPYPDDPALVRAAPADALFFVQWNGNAKADPRSDNRTEQLASQPQVRAFVRHLTSASTEAVGYQNRRDPEVAAQSRVLMQELWRSLAEPGCLFAVYDGGVPVDSDLRIGVVSRRGKSAGAALGRLATAFGVVGMRLGEADKQGFREAKVPSGAPIRVGVAGQFLVMTIGEIDRAKLLARLAPKVEGVDGAGPDAGPGLAANPRFKRYRASVAVERPSVRTFIDLQRLREVTQPIMGEEGLRVLRALGLDSPQALVSESGHDGREFANRLALISPDKKGLLGVVGGRSLAYADLEVVPGDADLAVALRVDPGKLLGRIRGLLDGFEPGGAAEFDRELGGFARMTGVDLEKDVLPHCGDTLLVWSAPSQGGVLFTGLTLGLRIHNAPKLREALKRWMKKAPRKPIPPGQRGRQLRHLKVADQTVYWINVAGFDAPFAPSWCVSDTHLLFSLFPQTLRSTLRAGIGGPNSMAMAQKIKLGKDTVGVGYVNSANVLRVGYPMLLPLGQLFCSEVQRDGVPLTLDALPTPSRSCPLHRGSSSGSKRRTTASGSSGGVCCRSTTWG